MPKNILWIEDDADIIGGVMRPLKEKGYKIKTLRTKKEYDDMKDDELGSFDLILLDILLPEGYSKKQTERYTGFSILKHIRDKRKLNTPVLILTGIQNDALFGEIRNYDVKKIIFKPILPSQLKNEVEEVL